MAKIRIDKAHVKEAMMNLHMKLMKDQAHEDAYESRKEYRKDMMRDDSLGRQDKDKLWVHKDRRWDIKKKIFMGKLR